jgi:hypothetical protein
MITIIIEVIKKIFLKNGIILSKVTSKKKLNYFFNKMKVYETDKELIRIGGNGDGGYLVPDDFENVKFCFSPGVSNFAYFEEHLLNYNIKSFLADFSVDKAPLVNPNIIFLKKFLGIINDEKNIKLETWVNSNCNEVDNNLILQMDIEGCEYDIIMDTQQDLLKKFRIIIIEFHDLQNLYNPIGFASISKCFDKLLENFIIVHCHPNNTLKSLKYKGIEIPPVMEFTFLRKDRVNSMKTKLNFPHNLDFDCVKENETIKLPKCWYNF